MINVTTLQNEKINFERHSKQNHEKPLSDIQKMRKLNKLKNELGIQDKMFDENDMIKLIEDTRGAVRELLKVIKWLRSKFGRKAFTPNLRDKIRAHLNILEEFHESEIEIFKDNASAFCI